MKLDNLINTANIRKWGALVPVFAAVLFLSLFFFVFPQWTEVIELDHDEGYNSIKALLVEQGHEFGTEIWSDQPPFFSYLLLFVYKIFGFDIVHARTLTLVFVSGLLFALYDILRRQYGHTAAVAGLLLFASTYRFTKYSVAVMIGFPSLSAAMLSVWALTIWQQSFKTRFAILSGALLGVSLSIKLFTISLVPIGVGFILLALRGQPKPKSEIRALVCQSTLWLFAVVAVFSLCSLPAIVNGSLFSLFAPHAKAALRDHTEGKRLVVFSKLHFPLYTTALLGAFASIRERGVTSLLFVSWLFAYIVILFFHHPVWYHHIFLLNLPAAALGGIFFHHLKNLLGRRGHPKRRALAITVAVLAGTLVLSFSLHIIKSGDIIRLYKRAGKDAADRVALEVIKKHQGPERTMVTSCQMLAFSSMSRIPPKLSVTSRKRFFTGHLTASEVVEEIRAWNVEQVVIDKRWNRRIRKKIEEAITTSYKRVFYDKKNHRLQIFVRKDLLERGERGVRPGQ